MRFDKFDVFAFCALFVMGFSAFLLCFFGGFRYVNDDFFVMFIGITIVGVVYLFVKYYSERRLYFQK